MDLAYNPALIKAILNCYLSYNCHLFKLYTLSSIFAQVHQHLLKNVERPFKEVVDKMESTLLTLDVENHLMSSAI